MNWFLKLRKRRMLESELDEEIAFHRNMRASDAAAGIVPPPFGNPTRIRESMREAWTFGWIETTLRDIAFALRGLRRNPGFAAATIGSLAVGIGVTIAIFTAADDLLFRPMPYKDADRLVMVWEANPRLATAAHNVISPGNFLDWKTRGRVFEDIAAFSEYKTNLSDGERSEQLRMQSVSANFFPLLGVRPWSGRIFTEAEDLASAHGDSLVLISYRLWQSWFGGEASAIGRRIMVNSLPRTVIGILPPDFYFRNREVDLWGPIGIDPAKPYRKTSGRYMMAVGRLRRGVGLAEAQVQMTGLARVLEIENPVFDKNWTVLLEPLRSSLVRDVRKSLLLLLGAVGLLLAVACANAASLLVARNSSRRAELAVRAALGAGPARLTRQLITESAILAVLAGTGGILLGWYALAGLVRMAPEEITRTAKISMDWQIVVFALILAAATGLVFGLVPALIASGGVAAEMKRGNRWGSANRGSARAGLVAGEIAVSVVLLAGASLLFRSLVKLTNADPGMNPDNVLTLRFSAPPARYKEPQRGVQLFRNAVDRIGKLPGVRSASAVSYLPFDGIAAGTGVTIGGRPPALPGEQPNANVRTVLPRYFETMGIPIRLGRDFTAGDNTRESPIRFIVSEGFVRKYLNGEDPLSKTISVEMDHPNPFGEIVGVVGDVSEGALGKAPEPTVYYVHAHLPYAGMTLLLRTRGDPLGLAAPVRQILHELDPAIPVADIRTMRNVLGETYARQRFSAILLAGFSISALFLAAIGIYGVLAYSVSERTREIGVRLAVGADAGRIVTMVLTEGARFVLAGLAVGMAGALGLSRLLSSLLFDTGARDPIAFTAAPAILLAVALLAGFIPARRASRLDPVLALRME
jgi:putative ABC transport system permease protein